jgi:hypothetical protein
VQHKDIYDSPQLSWLRGFYFMGNIEGIVYKNVPLGCAQVQEEVAYATARIACNTLYYAHWKYSL